MIGLPSLRALDGAQVARIWLAAEAADGEESDEDEE